MSVQERIDAFLNGAPHAVVGASRNRSKYGNKVLRVYQQTGREVYPVNPTGGEIEGLTAYTSLDAVPTPVHGVSIITPPQVTEKVVETAARLGIRHVWMQPGAESDAAVARAEELGLSVISGGPCILVVQRYHEYDD